MSTQGDSTRPGRVTGKTALVTGGARGMGRSHALALAREGARVAVTDICAPVEGTSPYETATENDLGETVRLLAAEGYPCLALKADSRDPRQVADAVAEVGREVGPIDILSVNHGVLVNRPWNETSLEAWNVVVETNLTGSWIVATAAIPQMIEQGGGAIVFTASTAAVRPYASVAAYSASKAGILGLTRSLATELAPHWIRVNALLPTNTASPMMLNQAVFDMYTGGPGGTVEDVKFPSEAALQLPVPWVQPEDLSAGLLFLVSEEARYVTGIELPIDAGTLSQPPGIPPSAAARIGELEARLAAVEGED